MFRTAAFLNGRPWAAVSLYRLKHRFTAKTVIPGPETPKSPIFVCNPWAIPRDPSNKHCLLELNLCAHLFEGGLDLVRLVLVDAFLDVLRGAFDQVLGFLEAETRERTDLLDDLDLLVAGGRENDRELGLLFSRSSATTGARSGSNGHRGRGGHAPLLFEHLGELGRLEDGQCRQLVYDLGQISH